MPSACTICPACRQPVREMRLGVRLPPIKAAILDAIKAAGDVGISSREIIDAVGHPRAVNTVRVHVMQMNTVMEEIDWFIASDGSGATRRWHLAKRRRLRAA